MKIVLMVLSLANSKSVQWEVVSSTKNLVGDIDVGRFGIEDY